MAEEILQSSAYEQAKTEESIAKNRANEEILKIIQSEETSDITSENAYNIQALKDVQNLLVIGYVYNNSQEETDKNNFEIEIDNQTLKANVKNGKIFSSFNGQDISVEIKDNIKDAKITKETRDHLVKHYSNTMYQYGKMYYLLQKSLGNPVRIKFKDLKTGKKIPLIHENGEPVSDSIRCVTPSTSVEIEYKDKYGKQLYLTLPGIKNVERAIEKSKIGGKYDVAYKKKIRDLRVDFAFKNNDLLSEVLSFVKKQKDCPFVKEEMFGLNERYSKAVSYYLSELNSMKFDKKYKKEELQYRKRLHEIGTLIEKNSDNVVDVMREVYDIAMDVAKYDKKMENYFNNIPLLSKYLSEFEGFYGNSDGRRDIAKEKNVKYEEMLKIYYKYLGGNTKYIREMAKISPAHENLSDIYRCAVITRYYDNIKELQKLFSGNLNVNSVNDKFYGNGSPNHEGFKNSRGYRDSKVIYQPKEENEDFEISFETQFRIAILDEGDQLTHVIYEEMRAMQEELRDCYNPKHVIQLKNSIKAKNLEIRSINDKYLAKYNKKTIQTAAEMEVALFRKEWKKKMDIPKNIETLKKMNKERSVAEYNLRYGNYTNPDVEIFLRDNILVSPFKALNVKEEIKNIEDIDYSHRISETKEKYGKDALVIKDEVDTKADMKGFARRYEHIIRKAYITTIKGEVSAEYFDDYDKALIERSTQNKRESTAKMGNKYSRNLSLKDRKIINKEENEYLKEKVAETTKTVNNIVQRNAIER